MHSGNWQYAAGVGADPREDRYFNIIKQAKDYDPDAAYIRLWCPELADLPTNMLIDPRLITPLIRDRYSINYEKLPEPVVELQFGGNPGIISTNSKGNYRDKKQPNHGNVPGRGRRW